MSIPSRLHVLNNGIVGGKGSGASETDSPSILAGLGRKVVPVDFTNMAKIAEGLDNQGRFDRIPWGSEYELPRDEFALNPPSRIKESVWLKPGFTCSRWHRGIPEAESSGQSESSRVSDIEGR